MNISYYYTLLRKPISVDLKASSNNYFIFYLKTLFQPPLYYCKNGLKFIGKISMKF